MAATIDPIDVPLPGLSATLDGLRIAHVSDLHVRKPAARARDRRWIELLAECEFDLLCLTGDYMTKPGDEDAALEVLRELTDRVDPPRGSFGVFGNHDSAELIERAAELPVRWLYNDAERVGGKPLAVLGLSGRRSTMPDAAALALAAAGLDPTPSPAGEMNQTEEAGPRDFRLLLAHAPDSLPTAADLGADLMLAGHTHGGQLRLPTGHALHNSSQLPLRLTSGLLHHRETLALVSRGLGEVHLPLRLFCPAHVPIYTLRAGDPPPPPAPEEATDIKAVRKW